MSFGPSETDAAYLSPDINIPEDWEEARLILTDYLLKVADAVNVREIAMYQDATLSSGVNISETVTGQGWFTEGDPNTQRHGQRTVLNFGLEDHSGGVSTQLIPHGITQTANTVVTRIFGVANNPSNGLVLPIPFTAPSTPVDAIRLVMDGTNVEVRYGKDLSGFTKTIVVIEYIESVA